MTIGAGTKAVALGGKNVVIMAGENENSTMAASSRDRREGRRGTSTTIPLPLNAATTRIGSRRSHPQARRIAIAVTRDAVKLVQALRQAGYRGVITRRPRCSADQPQGARSVGRGHHRASRLVPTTSTEVPEIKEFVGQMTAANPQVRIEDLGLNA